MESLADALTKNGTLVKLLLGGHELRSQAARAIERVLKSTSSALQQLTWVNASIIQCVRQPKS